MNRLLRLFQRKRFEQLDKELRFHLDEHAAVWSPGYTPAQARRAAGLRSAGRNP